MPINEARIIQIMNDEDIPVTPLNILNIKMVYAQAQQDLLKEQLAKLEEKI